MCPFGRLAGKSIATNTSHAAPGGCDAKRRAVCPAGQLKQFAGADVVGLLTEITTLADHRRHFPGYAFPARSFRSLTPITAVSSAFTGFPAERVANFFNDRPDGRQTQPPPRTERLARAAATASATCPRHPPPRPAGDKSVRGQPDPAD